MGYTDQQNRTNPLLLGGAMGVNALMIAGIMFAVPDVTKTVGDLPTVIIDLFKPTPPPVTIKPDLPKSETVKAQPVVTPPVAYRSPAQGENTLTAMGTLTDFPPVSEPSFGLIKEPEPVTLTPVFRSAALNPRYAADLQPEYPPAMIRQEIEGSVTLRVLVGSDGRVKAVEPVRFDAPAFLESARTQALRKWRFIPATRDGEAVESWREMTVRFQIPR